MKIKVNKEVRITKAQEDANRLFAQIEENAKHGIERTECWFDLPSEKTLTELENKLDASGTEYTWLIVRTGRNEFTGRPQSFTGERIGDQKRKVIRINS